MTRNFRLALLSAAGLLLPGCYGHHTADEEVLDPPEVEDGGVEDLDDGAYDPEQGPADAGVAAAPQDAGRDAAVTAPLGGLFGGTAAGGSPGGFDITDLLNCNNASDVLTTLICTFLGGGTGSTGGGFLGGGTGTTGGGFLGGGTAGGGSAGGSMGGGFPGGSGSRDAGTGGGRQGGGRGGN